MHSPCENSAQMPPRKSLNAAGKWAFLPCPTVARRWSKRLSLCNFTPCSVPAEPSFQHFSHDLRGEERRETHAPPSPFHFSPICGEIIFGFRNPPECEKQSDGTREGGKEGDAPHNASGLLAACEIPSERTGWKQIALCYMEE